MKLLLLGDAHLRMRSPAGRIDDFFQTQLRKFKQVLSISEEHDCGIVLQVGDFFDSPNPSNVLLSTYIRLLYDWVGANPTRLIYAVLGQHDMYMGSTNIDRTALYVVESSGVLSIIGGKWICGGGWRLWGASFGQSVPDFIPNKDTFDILVVHAAIGYPLFHDHKIQSPREFLDAYSQFDLIVCGDYHYPFIHHSDDRYIINPGALVRLSRSKNDLAHKPGVVVFDTDTLEYKQIPLEIEPVESVFDLTNWKNDVQLQEKSSLSQAFQSAESTVNFEHNLTNYFVDHNTSEEVQVVISETMDEIGATSSGVEQKTGR